MRFIGRNLHIFVFAALSLVSATWVAADPGRVSVMVRPLVEDAVELGDLGKKAYGDIRRADWQRLRNEAIDVYVACLRMPSMLFERLADTMKELETEVKRSRHSGAREETPGQGSMARAFHG
jgi:hypothetical protein